MARLTFKTTLDLHNLIPFRTLHYICGMEMEVLLHDTTQVVSLHIEHLFTTSQTHDLSFDLEDWRAIRELDAETVAAERDDFFFEDECFWACGKELGEHADGLGCWGEGGHGSDGVCLMMVLMLMFA